MNPCGQIAYLNGEYLPLAEARVSVLDRGFMLGDGVYELIPVYARKPFRLAEHLRRLQNSLAGIRLPSPLDEAGWQAVIMRLVELQPADNQSVYLQVTRGAAPRDHAFPIGVPPTVLAISTPMAEPRPEQIAHGICAVSAVDQRWGRCDLKTLNLLPNVLAKQQAIDAGCVECILFRDGVLTEGAASNIFAVKDGVILAPVKDRRMLPGITYDLVLELARANAMQVAVRDIGEAEVRAADELWLTSSGREVQAIVELDGVRIGNGEPGPIYRKMIRLYQAYKASGWSDIAHD